MNILQRYLSLIQVQLVLILKTPVFNSKIVQYTNFLCAFSIYVYPHSSGWVIALLLQYCRVFLQFESIAKFCLPFGCGDGVGVFFLFAVFCYCRYSRQRCYCYCKILDFIQVKLTDRWTDIRQKRLTSVVCGFVKIFSVFFRGVFLLRLLNSWISSSKHQSLSKFSHLSTQQVMSMLLLVRLFFCLVGVGNVAVVAFQRFSMNLFSLNSIKLMRQRLLILLIFKRDVLCCITVYLRLVTLPSIRLDIELQ